MIIPFLVTLVLVAILTIWFRNEIGAALGYLAGWTLDLVGLGGVGTFYAAIPVFGVSFLLLGASAVALAVGVVAHSPTAVWISWACRIGVDALLLAFGTVVLAYFRAVFAAARAVANLGVRIVWRLARNLRIVDGAAPHIGIFLPDAERNFRMAIFTVALADTLISIGIALLPAAEGLRHLSRIVMLATAFLLMVALWNFRSRWGRVIVGKTVLALLLLASLGFVEALYLRNTDPGQAERVRVCARYPDACVEAATTGARFSVFYEDEVRRVSAAIRAEHEDWMRRLEKRYVNPALGTVPFTHDEYVQARNDAITRYDARMQSLWRFPPRGPLSRAERREFQRVLGHALLMSVLATIGLMVILFAKLEPPDPNAPARKPWFWRTTFVTSGVLAFAVGGYLTCRHFARRPSAAKPMTVAAAPAPTPSRAAPPPSASGNGTAHAAPLAVNVEALKRAGELARAARAGLRADRYRYPLPFDTALPALPSGAP